MPPKTSDHPTSALVSSFRHKGRFYEHRLVSCGKPNCTRCFPPGRPPVPSHGPYWYLCAQRNRRWRRVYLGKELDTERFANNTGGVDWHKVGHRRTKGTPDEGMSSTPPGQGDMIDNAALAQSEQTP